MNQIEQHILDKAGPAFSLFDSGRCFGGDSHLDIVVVETPLCSAKIALQGAQLLSFKPADQGDWLWLSPRAEFVEGRPIRGGIPVCAPWFGVNRRDNTLPKHGFLRNRRWSLQGADSLADASVSLAFGLRSGGGDQTGFDWPLEARLLVELGREIALHLTIVNQGDSVMPLSFAFHSYFAVAGLDGVLISGLEGRDYLDNCCNLIRRRQPAGLDFHGEVDRVFDGVGGRQILQGGPVPLAISGSRCDTVVVWNPGARQAARMADIGNAFREFVCVERGMAFADELGLAAGAEISTTMRISSAS